MSSTTGQSYLRPLKLRNHGARLVTSIARSGGHEEWEEATPKYRETTVPMLKINIAKATHFHDRFKFELHAQSSTF
jgi:hypothetical protein